MFRPYTHHQQVTDLIVAQLEHAAASDFVLPWRRWANHSRPTNIATGNPYGGINVLTLWAAAEAAGFTSGVWGTYKQWAERGAQVRRGEKGSPIIFYRDLAPPPGDHSSDDGTASPTSDTSPDGNYVPRIVARASFVFAAEQVDGYEIPRPETVDPVTAFEQADTFIAKTGAKIIHGGERAFYSLTTETIHVPHPDRFIGSRNSTATEAYYSTVFHELIHWTGHPTRYRRPLSVRFGDQTYAAEELVAELGAAFLCADLKLTPAPRLDHAEYLKHWLELLQSYPKAIFTAAGKASATVAYLHNLQSAPCLPPYPYDPFL